MTKYAMVIDLHRCTGCGGCIIACKNENNLPEGITWSSKISTTEGVFPNVNFSYTPTLCNHCENAPCVAVCPTEAMHKIEGGITMTDAEKCIGCRYCMAACPYGVIYFNQEEPHAFWRDETAVIPDGTAAPAEVAPQVGGTVVPYANPETGTRPQGVVEKCTFCAHRLENGQLPYCVEACPANARIFGDLDDPGSEVNQLLGKYPATRLREDMGTNPKVFYIRNFNVGSYDKTKGGVE